MQKGLLTAGKWRMREGKNKGMKGQFWVWYLGEGEGLSPEVIPEGNLRAS